MTPHWHITKDKPLPEGISVIGSDRLMIWTVCKRSYEAEPREYYWTGAQHHSNEKPIYWIEKEKLLPSN